MPVVEVDPDDDATILYTSGTTGFPKGAVSTHRAVINGLMGFWCNTTIQTARKGEDAFGTGGAFAPCFILIVPLFHVTGCVPVMLSCFGMKFKLVMMHRWDPDTALRLIEAERVTTFVGRAHPELGHAGEPVVLTSTTRRRWPASAAAVPRPRPSWSTGSRRGSPGADPTSATA